MELYPDTIWALSTMEWQKIAHEHGSYALLERLALTRAFMNDPNGMLIQAVRRLGDVGCVSILRAFAEIVSAPLLPSQEPEEPTFRELAEKLSGHSCEGLTLQESAGVVSLHSDEFMENPRACFMRFMATLPDGNKKWIAAFMRTFVFSGIANMFLDENGNHKVNEGEEV